MPRVLLILTLLFWGLSAAHAAQPPSAEMATCRVGFASRYKLGCWTPVWVSIANVDQLSAARVEVVAPDGDGFPTVMRLDLDKEQPGKLAEGVIRVGRRDAELKVRLMDGDRLIHEWRGDAAPNGDFVDLRATTRLTVWVAAAGDAERLSAGELRVPASELPSSPMAYEGVNTLILSSGSEQQPLDLAEPVADAIRDWVRQGGRVVLIGGAAAERLLGSEGALRELSPGDFTEIAPLPSTGVIEDYADSDKPIDLPRGERLAAARLANVSGVIELYAGGTAEEMPLVVRSLYGFGDVSYVAFDPELPALKRWEGHERLMQLILQTDAPVATAGGESGQLIGNAYNDLAGALYVKLGQRFAGVGSVTIFALVAAVLVYVALLGPGAFFFGSQVARSMQSAWFTFPIIALAVGAGAWWWGRAATGDWARVNQAQLIDIDAQSGFERGFVWAQAFSPRAERYDLSCRLSNANQPRGYLSWHGLPGAGLGGMQTAADSLLGGQVRYTLTPSLDGLHSVPINRRASKAFAARWTADNSPAVRFELQPTDSGLVEGVIVNETGTTLTEVRLVAGGWAWRLADLPADGVVAVDAGVAPARLRSLLLSDIRESAGAEGGTSTADLVRLMMFHRALGAEAAASLANRYQEVCDLSHAVAVGRPVLFARSSTPRAQLDRDGQPLAPDADTSCVFYRFLGPALDEQP